MTHLQQAEQDVDLDDVIAVTRELRLARVESATLPGREAGLTRREAEVIGLIVQGLSNQEIADQCFLSINSVKSYIRSGYRRIDVANRTQAMAWAMQHGFGGAE